MNATNARRVAVPLMTGLLAMSLAGCVTIQTSDDPSASASPSDETTSTSSFDPNATDNEWINIDDGSTVTPSAKDPDGQTATVTSVPKETTSTTAGNDDTGFQAAYDKIASGASEQNCTDDLRITGNGQILKLTGDCDDVDVTGTGNMIIAEYIDSLEVTGTGNIIAVKTLDEVEATGVGNTIGWQNGNPEIDGRGTDNMLGTDALKGLDISF